MPSLNKTVNSKGQILHNKTWYPSDYNDVSGYNLATLYGKHIWTLPVKQETSIGGKIRSGVILKYNEDGEVLDGYNYENATLSDTVSHNKNTVLESNYNLKTSIRYDIDGNISQITSHKAGFIAYIWDYQTNGLGAHFNEVPVAMVQNADSNSVAYTSFENVSTGKWNLTGTPTTDATSPMGNKCFSFTGANISRSGLTSGTTYIVSYWSKSGSYSLSGNLFLVTGKTLNGWTYYEHQVTGITTLTITGTGYIDELRLYPKGALMTTYAYKFGVGLASQCDPSSRIVYYEYDNLQRLSLIRNEDKQIVKKICYNYTGQPINCGNDTAAIWTVISSVCEQSSGVNTGNLIVTEKNLNPSSGTYNQTRTVSIASAGACPVCNESNCTGNDKKCINGVCETGVRVNTGSVRLTSTTWRCYYHYVFSDASTSPTYDEIVGLGGCIL